MATITQTAPNIHEAEFNRQQWRIVKSKGDLAVWRLYGAQWKPVKEDNHEVRSLLRFYQWHLKSKQTSSELPTLYAVADGQPGDS